MANFSAEVDAWVRQSQARLVAVFKTSAQFVIQDVVGRVPVDTGFLKNSLTTSLEGAVSMNRDPASGYVAPPISMAIVRAQLGDVITASFAANYAGHVEYGARGRAGVAMVRLAAQNWQAHVSTATALAKARVGQ